MLIVSPSLLLPFCSFAFGLAGCIKKFSNNWLLSLVVLLSLFGEVLSFAS